MRSFARCVLSGMCPYVLSLFRNMHRLVELCLGDGAIAPRKLEAGMPMTALGVVVSLTKRGATFRPEKAKRDKWANKIKQALARGFLTSGEAAKLAGALQWAGQKTFRKLGRALLRPIFRFAPRVHISMCSHIQIMSRHIKAESSAIGKELDLALRWWLQVLAMDIAEERLFEGNTCTTGHLFTDARSTPPRVAAVLFMRVLAFERVPWCSNSRVVLGMAE